MVEGFKGLQNNVPPRAAGGNKCGQSRTRRLEVADRWRGGDVGEACVRQRWLTWR
jgi:hypothetical protein